MFNKDIINYSDTKIMLYFKRNVYALRKKGTLLKRHFDKNVNGISKD